MDVTSDVSVRAHCYHMACEANRTHCSGPVEIMKTAVEIYAWISATKPAEPQPLKAAA